MSAKIRNAPALFRSLSTSETVAIRLHQIVLYNSIYRADDQLMVNQGVYGISSSRTLLLCFASLRAAIWWILTVNIQALEPGVAVGDRWLRFSGGCGVAVVAVRHFRDDCGL